MIESKTQLVEKMSEMINERNKIIAQRQATIFEKNKEIGRLREMTSLSRQTSATATAAASDDDVDFGNNNDDDLGDSSDDDDSAMAATSTASSTNAMAATSTTSTNAMAATSTTSSRVIVSRNAYGMKYFNSSVGKKTYEKYNFDKYVEVLRGICSETFSASNAPSSALPQMIGFTGNGFGLKDPYRNTRGVERALTLFSDEMSKRSGLKPHKIGTLMTNLNCLGFRKAGQFDWVREDDNFDKNDESKWKNIVYEETQYKRQRNNNSKNKRKRTK